MKRLPSFFVVGAQKAGTTSLHNWLVQQPDICLPKLKETQFFTFDRLYRRGLDWYLMQFPETVETKLTGEICPDYMFFPEAGHRIKRSIEAPKLVFLFRHPIDRAFSHYLMTVRNGYEELSFSDALMAEEQRLLEGGTSAQCYYSYMSRGCYVSQIKHMQEIFPESGCLFIKFDDLVDRGEKGADTYGRICRFIGLGSSPDIADRSRGGNVASMPRSSRLRDFLFGASLPKRILNRLFPGRMLKVRLWLWFDRLNQRPVEKQTMGEIPAAIQNLAADEIRKLESVTGLDLDNWSVDEKRQEQG